MKENHPDLFEKAKQYEKFDDESGERYTWSERESLNELGTVKRIAEIKAKHEKLRPAVSKTNKLLHILGQDDDDDVLPCSFCHV